MQRQRALKTALLEQFAVIPKALASAPRLEILDLLSQAPRTVEKLAEAAGLSLANTSQHLLVLRQAGLVSAVKKGLFVTCSLAGDDVADLLLAVRRVASRRVAAIESVAREYLDDPDNLEPMDSKTVLSRVKCGEILVVDVRPEEEYRAGHLPRAVSIPLSDLSRRLAELPKHKQVVAYCRGPYCVYAADAVRRLRKAGYHATRLSDGVTEWRAKGLPLERSQQEPS
jgi:rhodanese-related sulfurtransferase/DNA-binding transcriptional ArsR family regulator